MSECQNGCIGGAHRFLNCEVQAAPAAPSDEGDSAEQWECGPHTNAWNGHDARCRRVPSESSTDTARAAASVEEGL